MLERLSDARRHGATLLTLDAGDSELGALAHDQLIVPVHGLIAPGEHSGLSVPATAAGLNDLDLSMSSVSFEAVQHLVSAAAGEANLDADGKTSLGRRRLRDRLGRALDAISGPSTSRDW